MVSSGGEDEPAEADRDAFVSKLQELKRKGSALLVVGNVPDSAAVEACNWMLGDDAMADRRRLFVSTDPDSPSISDRLATSPDRLRPETAALVTWTATSRSAATGVSGPPEPPYDGITPTRVESSTLGALGVAISREIEAFEEVDDGLAPSELRVCFDSLVALSANYDDGAVFRFLHVLVGRIRSVRAMAHFHFPVEYDSERVRRLAPLFDATIELRVAEGQPQQRWHLQGDDITSDWIAPSDSC